MTNSNTKVEVLAGMVFLCLCHVAYIAFVFFIPLLLEGFNILSDDNTYLVLIIWVIGISGIGIFQLLYAVPFYFHFRKQSHLELAKGVAIMAGLTLLLNGGCFIFLSI